MSTLADFGSRASFQRFVDDDINTTSRLDKGLHDEREQVSTHRQWRPTRSIEHLMKRAKVRIELMSCLIQGCRYGSAASCQHGPGQQDHHFLPGRCGKQWSKLGKNRYNGV